MMGREQSDIMDYRRAILRRDVFAPLGHTLDLFNSTEFDAAISLVYRVVYDDEPNRESSRVSFAANDIAVAVDEALWVLRGQRAGYYREPPPWEDYNEVGQLDSYALHAIVGLANEIVEKYSGNVFDDAVLVDTSRFAIALATLRDHVTSDFRECARLLHFTTEDEWRARQSDLKTLALLMDIDPRLALPPDVVDSIDWAFSGFDDYIAVTTKTDGAVGSIFSIFEFKSSRRSDELTDARQAIADVAQRLTDNPVEAAASRISRAAGSRKVEPVEWRFRDYEPS